MKKLHGIFLGLQLMLIGELPLAVGWIFSHFSIDGPWAIGLGISFLLLWSIIGFLLCKYFHQPFCLPSIIIFLTHVPAFCGMTVLTKIPQNVLAMEIKKYYFLLPRCKMFYRPIIGIAEKIPRTVLDQFYGIRYIYCFILLCASFLLGVSVKLLLQKIQSPQSEA